MTAETETVSAYLMASHVNVNGKNIHAYDPAFVEPGVCRNLTRNAPPFHSTILPLPLPNATWIALTAMQRLSAVPVLFVNDPILIVPGAQVNYNEFYQRALYDQYDETFNRYCKDRNLWCLDLWNILPPEEFTDSPLHHTANGNAIIAARVLEQLRSKQLG